MTEAEVKRIRTRHVEAIRALGQAEDMHARGEILAQAFPGSIRANIVLTLGRLALWMGRTIEQDCREKARATYWPKPKP